MTTVFLPSPFLSEELKVLKEPRWERLRLWYSLRETFLGEPIPEDLRLAACLVNSSLVNRRFPKT